MVDQSALDQEKQERLAGDQANVSSIANVSNQVVNVNNALNTEVVHRSEGDLLSQKQYEALSGVLQDKISDLLNQYLTLKDANQKDTSNLADTVAQIRAAILGSIQATNSMLNQEIQNRTAQYTAMETDIKKYLTLLSNLTMDSNQITMDNGEIKMGVWTILSQARQWDLDILNKLKGVSDAVGSVTNTANSLVNGDKNASSEIIKQAIEALSQSKVITDLDKILSDTTDKLSQQVNQIKSDNDKRLLDIHTAVNDANSRIDQSISDVNKSIEDEANERTEVYAREAQIRKQADDDLASNITRIDGELSDSSAQYAKDQAARQAQIDAINKSIDDLAKQSTTDLQNRINTVEQELANAKDGFNTSLQQVKDANQTTVDSLASYKAVTDNNISGIVQQQKATSDKASATAESLSGLSAQVNDKNTGLSNVGTIANSALSKATVVGNTLDSTVQTVSGLQQTVSNQSKSIDATNTAVQDLKANVSTNGDNIKSTISKVDSLDSTLKDAQGNITALGKSTDALTNNLQQTNNSLSTISDKTTQLRNDVDGKASTTALNNLNDTVVQNGKDISSAQSSITSLQNTVKNQDSNLTTLNNATSSLSNNINNVDGRVTSVSNSVTDLTNKINNPDTGLDALSTVAKSTSTKLDQTAGEVATKASIDSLEQYKAQVSGNFSNLSNLYASKADWQGTQASLTQQITSNYTSAINQLSVGGRNLIRNGNFADGTRYWLDNGGVRATFQDTKFTQAAQVSGSGYNGYFIYPISGWEIGQIYTFSVWLRNATIDTTIYIEEADKVYNVPSKDVVDVNSNTWVKYFVTVKKKTVNGAITIYLHSNGSYQLANAKLEKGNFATDWTPAPEDIQDSLSTNATAISNTYTKGDADKAIATQVSNLRSSISVGGRNLYIIKNTVNGFIKSDGSVYSDATTDTCSDFIPFKDLPEVTVQIFDFSIEIASTCVGFYDANKNIINVYGGNNTAVFVGGRNGKYLTLKIPLGTEYIRVSIHDNRTKNKMVKVEAGNIPTDWTPAPEDVDYRVDLANANLSDYKTAQTEVNNSFTTRMNNAEATLGEQKSSLNNIENTYAKTTEVGSIAQKALSSVYTTGINLARKTDTLKGWMRNDGTFSGGSDDYGVPNYYPCDSNTAITATMYKDMDDSLWKGLGSGICFYDSNKNPISYQTLYSNNNKAGVSTIYSPNGASFFRFSHPIVWYGNFKVERGSQSTLYTIPLEDGASTDQLNKLSSDINVIYSTKSDLDKTRADLITNLNSSADNKITKALEAYSTTVDMNSAQSKYTQDLKSTISNTDLKNRSDMESYVSGFTYSKADTDKAIAGQLITFKSNLYVGGRNLYTDTRNFVKGWVLGNFWAMDGTYNGFNVRKSSGIWSGAFQSISMPKGTQFTLSFYAKKTSDAQVGCYGELTDNSAVMIPVTEQWQRYSVSFKNTADSFNYRIENASNSGTIWICGLKLETGTIPSDWTPAPEDNDAAVNVVTSALTNFQDTQSTFNNTTADRLQKTESTLDNQASRINDISTTYAKTSEVGALSQKAMASVYTTGINLARKNNTLKGWVTDSGNFNGGDGDYGVPNYYPCDPYSAVTGTLYSDIAGTSGWEGAGICFYDTNKNVIWYTTLYSNNSKKGTNTLYAPANAAYFRFSHPVIWYGSFKVERGSVSTLYTVPLEDGVSAENLSTLAASIKETYITQVDSTKALADKVTELNSSTDNKVTTALGRYYTKDEADKQTSGFIQEFKSNFNVGGSNKIPNSDFLYGLDGWNSNGATLTTHIDQGTSYQTFGATRVCQIQAYGGAQGLWRTIKNVGKGSRVVASIWVYGTDDIANIPISIGTEAIDVTDSNGGWFTAKKGWNRYSVKGTWKADQGNITFYVYPTSGSPIFWMARPQLEVSDALSDWSICPEDIDKQFSMTTEALNNTYTQKQANEIIAGNIQSYNASLQPVLQNAKVTQGSVIDLYNLDPNTYYPVSINMGSQRAAFRLYATLDGNTYPCKWSSHSSGSFALDSYWESNPSGWGTIWEDRVISTFSFNWITNWQSPVIYIHQHTNASIEVVMLRGGGKYYLASSTGNAPVVHTDNWTDGTGQTTNPMPYNSSLVPITLKDATAQANSSLSAKVGDVPDGKSVAEWLTQLKSTGDGNSSTINSLMRTTGGTTSVWGININNNGEISGVGLLSELVNGQVNSSFNVNANYFTVGNNGQKVKPFIVSSNPQWIDGVQYPAGIWANMATFADASIGNAKINNLSADKITSGFISSDRIQSKSISVDKLTVGDLTNLWGNCYLDESKPVIGNYDSWIPPIGNSRVINVRDTIADWNTRVEVKEGDVIITEFDAQPEQSKQVLNAGMWVTDINGNQPNGSYQWQVGTPTIIKSYTNSAWKRYRCVITVQGSASAYGRLYFVQWVDSGDTSSIWHVANVTQTRGTRGELIVNGSITGDQIKGNSITADKLSVGSLSAITGNFGSFTTSNSTGSMSISGASLTMKYPNGVTGIYIGIE